MKNNFNRFLHSIKHKKTHFIFDLDKTLWDFTVENTKHIKKNDISNYIHSSRPIILKTLQDEGHSLSIASRSKESKKCLQFLDTAFPTIHFASKQIFYTPTYKTQHIENIFKDFQVQNEHQHVLPPFFFFDDELHILQHTSKHFYSCIGYHTPVGLNFNTFDSTPL